MLERAHYNQTYTVMCVTYVGSGTPPYTDTFIGVIYVGTGTPPSNMQSWV